MTLRARLLARPAGLAVAAAIGLAAALVVASPASAAAATFTKAGAWPTGYVGNMTVLNNTTVTITSWRVEFDLPAGTTIPNYWSARASVVGNHYVFTNESWNATLAPNASTTFGWVANGLGEPFNCTVNGGPCSGSGPDTERPTAPTNLRFTFTPGQTLLTWNASTDNVGVVRYDIAFQGSLIGSTATTSFPIILPTSFGTFVWRVTAYDAAGNASAPASLQLAIDPAP